MLVTIDTFRHLHPYNVETYLGEANFDAVYRSIFFRPFLHGQMKCSGLSSFRHVDQTTNYWKALYQRRPPTVTTSYGQISSQADGENGGAQQSPFGIYLEHVDETPGELERQETNRSRYRL